MYRLILIFLALIAIFYIFRCKAGGEFPGREYMPDMAHSRPYDVYYPGPGTNSDILNESGAQEVDYLLFKDRTTARKPVEGTIARGYAPYPYNNNEEGYEASVAYQNPYTANLKSGEIPKDVLDVGKEKYDVYCGVCHGAKGEGDGSISILSGGPYAGVPNYYADTYMEMPEGKMFHSVHYGRNDMGSYASQLTKDERWKVIAYIKSMQQKKAMDQKKLGKAAALMYVQGNKASIPTSPTGEFISSKLTSIDKLEKGKAITLDNVFFDTGSANLRAESYYELNLLKDILTNNAGSRVEISGHTDNAGNPASNLTLSQRRASAVFNYLLSQGVGEGQVTAQGYGEARPVAPNDTPENMQKNRRVDFEVID